MRNARCLSSTATALHRVFVTPVEQLGARFPLRTATSPGIRSPPSKHLVHLPQRRCYALATSALSNKRRLPRDDQINDARVVLVNPDNSLSDPISTKVLLADLDRTKSSLVVVDAAKPGAPAVCKILNKKAMRESEKARSKAAKHPGLTTKTLEMNWAIDPNDLQHRLRRMTEFLAKGYKVEIVLAPKRKGKAASLADAQQLIRQLEESVGEVEGAKESRPREGNVLAQLKLFYDGNVQK